ncbi:MAG TPA: hypothetical protein DEA08_11250 [Planctomycetes bacterium]|nr:hypothetical protein [Planctomycetota bacterium]
MSQVAPRRSSLPFSRAASPALLRGLSLGSLVTSCTISSRSSREAVSLASASLRPRRARCSSAQVGSAITWKVLATRAAFLRKAIGQIRTYSRRPTSRWSSIDQRSR